MAAAWAMGARYGENARPHRLSRGTNAPASHGLPLCGRGPSAAARLGRAGPTATKTVAARDVGGSSPHARCTGATATPIQQWHATPQAGAHTQASPRHGTERRSTMLDALPSQSAAATFAGSPDHCRAHKANGTPSWWFHSALGSRPLPWAGRVCCRNLQLDAPARAPVHHLAQGRRAHRSQRVVRATTGRQRRAGRARPRSAATGVARPRASR